MREVNSELRPQEVEVFQMIADGKITKQIASEKNLTLRTIETYRQHTLVKLEANSSSHAVAILFRKGLIK